jgi:cystathionine beta-lyase/cystathionine gamma-synthase
VNYLKKEQNIDRVYYADGLKNGNGHVISFELKEDSFRCAEAFYDNCTLPIKGPSMGYEKSMMMPYTLITHYKYGDEYLEKIGLNKYLMRFSVGTESVDEIIGHLSNGLIAVAQLKL